MIKSKKYLAAKANELVAAFAKQAPANPNLEEVIKQAQAELEARQIAPQNIVEQLVLDSYRICRLSHLKVNDEAFQLLKEMEALSRERSILPLFRYDPWT